MGQGRVGTTTISENGNELRKKHLSASTVVRFVQAEIRLHLLWDQFASQTISYRIHKSHVSEERKKKLYLSLRI